MLPVPVIPEASPPAIIALPLALIRFCYRSVRRGIRRWWHLPRFERHLVAKAEGLSLANEIPRVQGNPLIQLGRQCRLGGQVQILSSNRTTTPPGLLSLGHQVHIGHHTTLVIGQRICLGNGVRIAAGSRLLGQDDDRSDILLEDGVTIGTGCTLLGSVHIGQGTLVAPGSLVTSDLPAGVYAAGRPARALCLLANPQE